MPFDPKPTDRAPEWRPQLHRRDVLRFGALAAAGLAAAPLLAACTRENAATPGGGAPAPRAASATGRIRSPVRTTP